MDFVSRSHVEVAYQKIRSDIIHTPLTYSQTFSDLVGSEVFLKHELLQMTGSFKERGALHRLLSLTEEEKESGVAAASAGNHAQGLAYHGKRLGIPVKIVMPTQTAIVKITSTKYWQADVILHGSSFDDAYQHSKFLAKQEGLTYIHPFEDPLVIAGQGTIGIEILEDLSDLEAVLVPVGGGGLISGIAAYVKAVRPDIRIVGIESDTSAGMTASVREGKPVSIPAAASLADGISIKRVGDINLEMARQYVDEMVTVTEDEIANAILLLLEIEKITVEGAGAVTLAALLNRKVPDQDGKRILCVLSGGNIDVNILARIIARGLAFDGRTMRLTVVLQDVPGALMDVLKVFYENGANVLDVDHHHYMPSEHFGQISVSFTLETRDREHIDQIRKSLDASGYQTEWKA